MMQAYNVQSSKGFTLIELIISVAIGVFLIAGVFSVYVNGLSSQRAVDDQVALIDNARFVIETISADLRQAGVFGRTRDYTRIEGNNFNVAGECENGWTVNATRPIFAYDETSPYAASCTSQYMPSDPLVGGSDVIEMRYSLREPVALGNLQANKVYVSANVNATEFFTGLNTPGLGADYPYVARLYYLSNHTDSPGDGIEALHRVSLGSGPVVTDEVLLSGVEELHIQLGLSSAAPAGGTDNGIVT
jgi:prepilin-type N-terminal cleavage/methylation domain-containing protein